MTSASSLPGSPWIGTAYRHIRAGAGRDVLDFAFAGTFARNRWNEPGEPTLYLAGDPGVLVAEWGRQLQESFSADVAREVIGREVFRLNIRLDRIVDARDPNVGASLGVTNVPTDYLDRSVARAVAARVRDAGAQGMLVPSVAFLDDVTRWNLVVFLNKVSVDTKRWVQHVDRVGFLRWE